MNWIFNRTSGVRISDQLEFQNGRVVVIENESLRVVCLPAKGADIVSFYSKKQHCECLLSPVREFTPVDNNPNLPGYIAGSNNIWPEMFPTASAYGNYCGIDQPMHGEAHLLPWRYDILLDTPEEVRVRFACQMQMTPLKLERTLTLKAGDPTLYFDEKVTNLSHLTMPLNWGHHPTFGAPFLSEHCKIYLPEGKLVDGDEADLQIQPPNSGKSAMFYLTDFTEGYYGIFNHQKRVGFGMGWDPAIFQTIWLWQCLNVKSQSPWYGRAYTAAVEPVMSFPQTAEKPRKPDLYQLAPDASLQTELRAFLFDDPEQL